MGLLGASPGHAGWVKLYLGGGGGGWGGVFWGGGGGGCVHQNRAYRSKVPGGCAKTTDLSNY